MKHLDHTTKTAILQHGSFEHQARVLDHESGLTTYQVNAVIDAPFPKIHRSEEGYEKNTVRYNKNLHTLLDKHWHNLDEFHYANIARYGDKSVRNKIMSKPHLMKMPRVVNSLARHGDEEDRWKILDNNYDHTDFGSHVIRGALIQYGTPAQQWHMIHHNKLDKRNASIWADEGTDEMNHAIKKKWNSEPRSY